MDAREPVSLVDLWPHLKDPMERMFFWRRLQVLQDQFRRDKIRILQKILEPKEGET